MARICDVCGKTVQHGNRVSNSYNHTKHTWKPNIHKVKATAGGTTRTINVCAQCLRSGFVVKKVHIPKDVRIAMQEKANTKSN